MYIYGCHDISRAGDGSKGLGMSDWFWQSFFIFGGDELGRSSSSLHVTFAMHSRWFSTPLKTNGWNPKIGALGRCFEPFPALREFSRSISRFCNWRLVDSHCLQLDEASKKLTHWWKGVEVEEWEGLHPSSRESQRLFFYFGGEGGGNCTWQRCSFMMSL